MKNIRFKKRGRRPSHPDFEWMMSLSHPTRSSLGVTPKRNQRHRQYVARLNDFEAQFGVLRWGAGFGRIEIVSNSTSGHIYWIKDVSDHGKVREIIESIDFEKEIIQYWMGAPSVLIEDFVAVYERKREEWKSQKKL